MEKTKQKKILISLSALTAVFILVFLLYSPVIFQEGNPAPIIKGIAQLIFRRDEIAKMDEEGERYMTKSRDGQEALLSLMDGRGYRFLSQMGSGYFFENDAGDRIIASRRQFSRFYSIWTITASGNVKDSIKWLDYENEEYGFTFSYPSLSIDSKLLGALPEGMSVSDVLLPNQVLSKGNNFYFHQKYDISTDWMTGKSTKTENTFIPEYCNTPSYPLPWHIVILPAKNEDDLDKAIKQKLGSGCSYKTKVPTGFSDNYRIEIDGDGKDLGSTACPVNYANYIIYSPARGEAAFWGVGQECQTGLGFMYDNCFDQKISESFHFID